MENNDDGINGTNEIIENQPQSTKSTKNRGGWLFVLAALIFIGVVFVNYEDKSIVWMTDLDAARKIAREKKLPLLITCHKQNASHVTWMKQTTYNNEDVIAFIDRNFIPVLINYEENPTVFTRYRITLYPTQVIKYPNQSKYMTIIGHHHPPVFIDRMQKALEEIGATPK